MHGGTELITLKKDQLLHAADVEKIMTKISLKVRKQGKEIVFLLNKQTYGNTEARFNTGLILLPRPLMQEVITLFHSAHMPVLVGKYGWT